MGRRVLLLPTGRGMLRKYQSGPNQGVRSSPLGSGTKWPSPKSKLRTSPSLSTSLLPPWLP